MQNIDKSIGAKIKQLRLHKRYSREQLGRKLGVCQQQIEKYEIGENRISASMLMDMAKIFNIQVQSFYDE
jgi:transcriptional regulator with XRE-family HTH domain